MPGLIREEDINEIREKADLVEIVSHYVNLKKSGRIFKGLCPFHHEKTPSFVVDPSKQLYHCFGCSEGGNVYTFVMKIDNLDFPETVRYLAERIGYHLRYEKPEETQKLSHKARLYEALNQAMLFYHQLLTSSSEGQAALTYLKNRGYVSDTVNAFNLGFAPGGWNTLLNHLRSKGFNTAELLEVGLIVKGERGASSYYDRFRARIIFPIFDLRGRTIAFGGRILEKEKGEEPKYLNSPETPIYHKSANLYGLFHAKSEMVKAEQAVVVEGYTDVLSLHQAGVSNAVATLGTAFTPEHIRLLARFTEKIILVFDPDVAGSLAAERGFDLLGESNVDIYVVSLPVDTDPADFVTSKGAEEFRKFLHQALPLVEFCINQVISRQDITKPVGRIKACNAALSLVAVIPNIIAQEQYLKKLSEKFTPQTDISYESLLAELKKKRKSQKTRPVDIFTENGKIDGQGKTEQEILKFILQFPDEAEIALQELEAADFTLEDCRELFVYLQNTRHQSRSKTADLLNRIHQDNLRDLGSKLLIEPLIAENRKKYLEDILKKLKEFTLQRQINILKSQLEKLNPTKDSNYDTLFEQLLELEASRRKLREK